MEYITVEKLKEILTDESKNTDVDFINVCTPEEYRDEHIPGIRSVPLDTLAARVKEFEHKKKIYIHCRSGYRSRQAIENLKQLGVTAELVNIEGGITAWNEAGFSTTSH